MSSWCCFTRSILLLICISSFLRIALIEASKLDLEDFKKRNHEIRVSSNTQTLVILTLKTGLHFIPYLRSNYLFPSREQDKLRIDNSSPPQIQDVNVASNQNYKYDQIIEGDPESLEFLQKTLMMHIFENSSYLFEEALLDLYRLYPGIDHLNIRYFNPNDGSSRSILHLIVLSSHTSDLLEKFDDGRLKVDPCIVDSDNFTPLEFAFKEQNDQAVFDLIKLVKGCVKCPFMGFESLVHYAAANDRVDLLQAVKYAKRFDFSEDFTNPKDRRYSPLELAVFSRKLNSIKYLMSIDASARVFKIQAIYLTFIKDSASTSDVLYAIFLISNVFKDLMYCTVPKQGHDIMLMALRMENKAILHKLVALGYDSEECRMSVFYYNQIRISLSKFLKCFGEN